jgi:hypothetical protein
MKIIKTDEFVWTKKITGGVQAGYRTFVHTFNVFNSRSSLPSILSLNP